MYFWDMEMEANGPVFSPQNRNLGGTLGRWVGRIQRGTGWLCVGLVTLVPEVGEASMHQAELNV